MPSNIVDHAALWADGRYFAQVSAPGKVTPPPETLGVEEAVVSVAKQLLGDSYKLGENIVSSEDAEGLEVYSVLTQVLPVLSEQSKFFWDTSARTLASMLSTAKYPIHAQTSHLIFWWARLGGINGPTTLGTTKETRSEFTRDGSCTEFSWVLPRKTDPKAPCNRKIRFAIDPFHPEIGTRLAGGATTDFMWSDVGGMGLVSQKGGKEWRDLMEKWLFPNLESTEQVVPGCTYFTGFDLEPSGSITLKHYYMPPPPTPDAEPQFTPAITRLVGDLAPFESYCASLHPSLVQPLNMLRDYLANDGKDSGLLFAMVACDLTTLEKNRLKLYLWTPRHTLNEIVRNMTLGGRLTGPNMDDAMANLKKLFKNLFPYATNDDVELRPQHLIDDIPEAYDEERPGRHTAGLLYYYEFFVDQPTPFSKVYFLMDFFGKNDLTTANAVESFLKEVGKPGEPGWFPADIGRAHRHRDLSTRTGTQTGVSFGIKPAGWDLTGYYTPEAFRATEAMKNNQKV